MHTIYAISKETLPHPWERQRLDKTTAMYETELLATAKGLGRLSGLSTLSDEQLHRLAYEIVGEEAFDEDVRTTLQEKYAQVPLAMGSRATMRMLDGGIGQFED